MDDVLDAGAAAQIAQHLNSCENCRKEYESLFFIKQKLQAIPKIKAPAYLRSLIQHRLAAGRQESWRCQLRNVLERRWSIIRTTESTWYLTKALGTVMTSLCVLLITSVITPYNVNAANPMYLSPAYRQQLGLNVMIKLGMQDAPNYGKSEAAINDIYFVNFGQSVSPTDKDDNLSVVAYIDRSGAAKIQGVLEYPQDSQLLSNFNQMIANAQCRPANKNGQAVSSRMVLVFNQVSVNN